MQLNDDEILNVYDSLRYYKNFLEGLIESFPSEEGDAYLILKDKDREIGTLIDKCESYLPQHLIQSNPFKRELDQA